jgi:tetratricopeptide (TPR) repeat protein
LFPCAAIALLAGAWLFRRYSRAPIAALLIFGGTLFPVLGFVNVYPFIFSFVADHFQYLASIAVITLLAAGIAMSLRSRVAYAVTLLLVSLLGVLTWRQARMYRDAETLYAVTLERNPDCWMAHNNLSTVLFANGDIDGAMAHSEKALAIRPNDYEPHLSLGDALVRKHQFDEAIAHFQQALKLKPEYAETHTHLGSAYMVQRRPAEAISEFEKTIALAPNSLYASNDLAWLLATCPDVSLRNGTRAVQLAEKANHLAGGENASVLRTLAAAYAQSGQVPRAIETAQRARQSAGNDTALVAALHKEIELYRSHLP